MAPTIRVGIIGLSASTEDTTAWAAKAHLPYLLASPHYEITALCNSSVEAAQRAVKKFNLSPEVKTFGNPYDIAADPNVDLVVVVVRVDRHALVAMPSLRAGKHVFVEVPMGQNLAEATEMLEAARQSASRTMVAFQDAMEPRLLAVKNFIADGRIGRVISSDWLGSSAFCGSAQPAGFAYMLDRKMGGTIHTIVFGHTISGIFSVLGAPTKFSSFLATQIPETKLIDVKTKSVVGTMTKNTPDQILLHAELESGALLSYHLSTEPVRPGRPELVWRIVGTEGDVEFVASSLMFSAHPSDVKISSYSKITGQTVDVPVPEDEFEKLPWEARNIGRMYEAFRKNEMQGILDFELMVKRHAFFQEMMRRWDTGEQTSAAGID